MHEQALLNILRTHYGLDGVSLQHLRDGGSSTYLVEGKEKYFLKVIGAAFEKTARQSVAIMVYLERCGFPVPKTILTCGGEALLAISVDGEDRLVVLQEYIDGDEPDLEAKAAQVGALVGQLHKLLAQYPEQLVTRDRQFFIGRYLDMLRQKQYPRVAEYEALGDMLWQQVAQQPTGNCHGDLHRGNLLEAADGRILLVDFDTVCHAPRMFDVMVMCDMTNYFDLQQADVEITKTVYSRFLSGYGELSAEERCSLKTWVALRHFQLQATIYEIHGLDRMREAFVDAQLAWLQTWLKTEI